jgi:D-3-phosphoglycerate dehydrogenase
MYRILISDKLGAAGLEFLDHVDDVEYDLKTNMSKGELLDVIPDYEALIVRSGTKVDAEVLDAASKLKIVGRAGMGVDNIDVKAATMRGIIVMNTPAANSIATAEQTFALMLAVSRHTVEAHHSLASGEWKRSQFVGFELHGKVLGIIGFGKIGRLVARRAQAFGMEVLACDPYVSEEVGREMGVSLLDMDDLLAQSDYVTLHAALLPETEKMITEAAISQMRDTAVIINVARGKLIDEQALADALQQGKIRAAAIDVYSSEPPATDNPLLRLPNVLHTPHLGASTVEAQRTVATEIADQVVNALRGSDFRNAINMPFPAGPDFATILPYMTLAEKLGSLHATLADGSIRRVEIEVHGDAVTGLVRAIAAALLKGMIAGVYPEPINYVNAPILASKAGISLSQTRGTSPIDYPNLISSRVHWDGGENLLAGMLFGGREPRVVRVNNYTLDAKPEGILLILQNEDVPGVIGQIGTILAAYKINIGEWRMGRDQPGGEALSFISLDSEPSEPVLGALEKIAAVTHVELVRL